MSADTGQPEPRIHGPLLDTAYTRVIDEGRYSHVVCVACFTNRVGAVVEHWLKDLFDEPPPEHIAELRAIAASHGRTLTDDQLLLEDRRSKVTAMIEFGLMLGAAAVDAEQEQIMGEATRAG